MANIGDSVSGGTVFYTGATGGLIAATEDFRFPLYWGCYKLGIGCVSTVIDSGLTNTMLIVSGCTGNTMIAADVCYNLVLDGYSDWYLPSKDELNQMYLQKSIIGNFSELDNYWSSSEYTPETAWMQFFGNGTQSELGDKDQLYRVRPIRSF